MKENYLNSDLTKESLKMKDLGSVNLKMMLMEIEKRMEKVKENLKKKAKVMEIHLGYLMVMHYCLVIMKGIRLEILMENLKKKDSNSVNLKENLKKKDSSLEILMEILMENYLN